MICLRKRACSSGCKLYGFNREASAAAIHCLAYSDGAISVGIETFGRTSYLGRRFPEDGDFESSLGSIPVGDVALLDTDEWPEEASDISVIIDEAKESRALSGLRYRLPCEVNLGLRSALTLEVNIYSSSPPGHLILMLKLESHCRMNIHTQ